MLVHTYIVLLVYKRVRMEIYYLKALVHIGKPPLLLFLIRNKTYIQKELPRAVSLTFVYIFIVIKLLFDAPEMSAEYKLEPTANLHKRSKPYAQYDGSRGA